MEARVAPLAALAVILAVVIAVGCGGDDDDTSEAVAEREQGILGSYEITERGDPTVGPSSSPGTRSRPSAR